MLVGTFNQEKVLVGAFPVVIEKTDESFAALLILLMSMKNYTADNVAHQRGQEHLVQAEILVVENVPANILANFPATARCVAAT